MLIFGHPFIKYLPFYEIISIETLKNTPSNSTVIFDFDIDLLKYCKKNNIKSALRIKNIKELMFSNALECDFVIANKEFITICQKIANEYMFDTKILLFCKTDEDLEWAALQGIDGVIFQESIMRPLHSMKEI